MNKIATDLDQSRKLAEILPLESADMFYNEEPDETYPKDILDTKYPMVIRKGQKHYLDEYGIPCWSLAALLDIIPYNITFNKAVYRFKLVKFSEHWECYHENFGTVSTNIFEADNPIDVCYEMIIFLHDKNLI